MAASSKRQLKHTDQLVEDGELTSKTKDALLQELDSLINCWNATLRDLFDQGLCKSTIRN
jgi:hypothetical protein